MPRRNKTIKHVRLVNRNNCTLKRKYPTEQQAKQAAEYQTLLKPDLELSVYKCEMCCKWHLTTNNDSSN